MHLQDQRQTSKLGVMIASLVTAFLVLSLGRNVREERSIWLLVSGGLEPSSVLPFGNDVIAKEAEVWTGSSQRQYKPKEMSP